MTHQNTRQRAGDWKVWRTGLTGLTDAAWADDPTTALPAAADRKQIPLTSHGTGHVSAVEFVVIGYVQATRLVSANDADTFSCDMTFLVETPDGSSIGPLGGGTEARSGNVAGEEKIVAIRQTSVAGLRYFTFFRFDCNGADAVVPRLHTATGLPGAADRLEVWYREIMS